MPSPPPTPRAPDKLTAIDYAAVMLAWLIPGSGHILIGQKKRGVLFAVAIHLLFFGGLFIGGLQALYPPRQPIWGYTQYVAGWPMLIGDEVKTRMYPNGAPQPVGYSPKIEDVGTVYCGIAGMLNLLVIFDVLVCVSDRDAAAGRDGEEAIANAPSATEAPA